MRRLFLVLLMFMLPLQSTWAAVASICAHELDVQASHLGHHAHAHDDGQAGAENNAGSDADPGTAEATSATTSAASQHGDCGVCHGTGAAFPGSASRLPAAWSSSAAFPPYKAPVFCRVVDTPLRPPLDLVGC